MTYLSIRNWERYQNADIFKKSGGRPPWVKLYRDMLEDEELVALPYGAQLLFDRLLLVAASKLNAIRSDAEWIAGRTRIDSSTVAEMLPLLVKGGWLSQTKTPRRSRKFREPVAKNSPPRIDVDVDKKTPQTPLTENSRGRRESKAALEHLERLRLFVQSQGMLYPADGLREELRTRGATEEQVAELVKART